jgi:[ribosomal protein S18]-alanine N-acetyltransferase
VPGDPRPIADGDLARIAAIERAIFPDPWSRDAFVETLARPDVYGIASDGAAGQLVGYGICSLAADEGEILNLAVDTAARRLGIGRRLLGAMLSWLEERGASRVFLEVRGSNAAALTLYAGAGFQRMGVRRGYYRRPREDAVTMVLEVGPKSALKG